MDANQCTSFTREHRRYAAVWVRRQGDRGARLVRVQVPDPPCSSGPGSRVDVVGNDHPRWLRSRSDGAIVRWTATAHPGGRPPARVVPGPRRRHSPALRWRRRHRVIVAGAPSDLVRHCRSQADGGRVHLPQHLHRLPGGQRGSSCRRRLPAPDRCRILGGVRAGLRVCQAGPNCGRRGLPATERRHGAGLRGCRRQPPDHRPRH